MSLDAATYYALTSGGMRPAAVFRLIDGEIEVEDLESGDRSRINWPRSDTTRWLEEWFEGTWDAREDRMVTPDEGERYLEALIDRPMTYFRFEPGEPDPRIG